MNSSIDESMSGGVCKFLGKERWASRSAWKFGQLIFLMSSLGMPDSGMDNFEVDRITGQWSESNSGKTVEDSWKGRSREIAMSRISGVKL